MEHFNIVREYLLAPEYHHDFWNSDALVWIDWGEFDEDIVQYFAEKLGLENLFAENVDADNDRGFDIVIHHENETHIIDYPNAGQTDRDTTIREVNKVLNPDYEIRWYVESLGSDTLGFVVLRAEDWAGLEQEFGEDLVNCFFLPTDEEVRMFDLDIDEVAWLLDQRASAKK